MKGLYNNKLSKFKDKDDEISLSNSAEVKDFKGFK